MLFRSNIIEPKLVKDELIKDQSIKFYSLSYFSSIDSIIKLKSIKIIPIISVPNYLPKSIWVYKIEFYNNLEDRQNYRQALVDYLTPYKDELDPDSQDRLIRNPMRILDSKDERTQEIAQNAPSILDYLGSYSQQHFEKVQQLLSDLGIK